MFVLGPRNGSAISFRPGRQAEEFIDRLNALSSAQERGRSVPGAFDIQMSPGNMQPRESLTYLLDSCVLYYYAVAHKYTIMVGLLRKYSPQFLG